MSEAASTQQFPCSFAQQRLWFLEQLEGPGAAYNVRLAVRLRGALDAGLMQQALDALVARHEALRTTLQQREGVLLQVVADALQLPLELVDMEGQGELALRREVGRLSRHVFDLAEGPLLRAWLLRAAADDHVLLLLSHHVISDAWSSGLLFRDLMASYRALRDGGEPQLPELPVQYADYAAWQREWLQGEVLEQQLAWWRKTLEGAPPLLELPTDRPRPALQGYRGDRWTHILPAALVGELHALCRREGCTPFMTLLAVFAVLLARHAGQEDLVIGTPIAGRRRTELEAVVGFFANTLALRVDLSGNPGFDALLARVRRGALAAYAHQDLPFEKLVEALRPARSLSHAPIFQVMFILQNTPWEAGAVPGLVVEPAETDAIGSAKFDLTLSATEFAGELWLGFEYNSDLFAADSIRHLAAHFERLLRAAIADPATAIDELAVPDAGEADGGSAVQGAVRPLDPGLGVHHLVLAQVAQRPDACAIVCGTQRWSYAELDDWSAALAARLQALGAAPGSVVGIALERSPQMLGAVLGVLRAGCTYLPLDPAFPDERLHFMLEDAGARWLLSERRLAARFAAIDGLLCIEDLAAGDCALAPAHEAVHPGQLAYLIYTSGSTGRPKGVRVGHGGVVNFLRSMLREPGIRAGDRWLAVTTLSFDIAVLELLGPLAAGATVVLATAEEARDGDALRRLLASGIDIMQATPATWRLLLAAGWEGTPGLRMLCGGEALPPALAAELLPRGAQLWNLYGPTETTVWSSCARIHAADDISAGLPIDNTQVHILDARLRPLPDGVPGEICIGGAGVAAGYHRRPELGAERFVDDPAHPGSRLYRTGDRGRRLADGRIQVLGRFDDQLKLRGFRIEPAEVEAALGSCAGVEQCAVGLRPAAGGEPALVAWLRTTPPRPAVATLRTALRRLLPDYLVPAHFVFLDQLPQTANGKLDRRALQLPADIGSELPHVAPRTPLEAALCELFAAALGLQRAVGIDEDFFALGGHSLLAMQLASRIRSVLALELPLRSLFESPTVAGLAGALAQLGPLRLPARIPRAPRQASAPLSLAQQRLWFLEQLTPGSSAYHLHALFRLRGRLDAAALAQACRDLMARHATLRTAIGPAVDGEGEQRIAEEMAPDIASLSPAAGEDVSLMLGRLVDEPFDIAAGPLWRLRLLEISAGESLLLLVMHHIISDGWSMAVLLRELSICYAARHRGEMVELPPLALQYADYARWQHQQLAGGELERQLDWWHQQLRDPPLLIHLPADRPRQPLQRHRGARLGRDIDRHLVAALHALAQRERATLFMVLLAGFQALLSRYTGDEDLLVGTPVAGRERSELEGLIGFFVNMLVLRGNLGGNPSLREIVARTREAALGAYAHAEVPFEKLVEVLQPPRDASRTPLFQVMFNLHNEPVHPLRMPGLEVVRESLPRRTAKFDLSVSLLEHAQGLSIGFEYDTDLFDRATIERLAADYERMLQAFVDLPEQRLGEVVLEAAAEGRGASSRHVGGEDHAVSSWHAGGEDRGGSPRAIDGPGGSPAVPDSEQISSLPLRLVEVVAAQPDKLAVQDAAGVWSYAQLQQQLEQVAARLAASGSRGPVALLLGHDRLMVAGLLGTLRAGCAYVPLDPYAPRARHEQVLTDAGAGALVSDAAHLAAAPWLAECGLALVLVDAPGEAAPLPPLPTDPEAPAYLLYTSGSTGRPKAVRQRHGHVLGLVGSWSRQLAIGAEDRLAMFSGYGYDAAVQDLFGALLHGASLHLLDLRGGQSAPELVDRIATERLTLLHFTPTVYRYLFGGRVTCDQNLSAVRLVVLGGEEARRSDLDLFKLRFPRGARFVNGLGLSECTTVLQYFADHDTRVLGDRLPVGHPVPGVEIRLAEGDWQGALEIASPWLAEGCGPWYRSGDRLRLLPDGQWQHAGREDRQLKLRGMRIEPAEVEAVVREEPGIAEVVVRLAEVAGEGVLVAYVVAGGSLDEAALRSRLRSQLPEYLVPGAFVQLEQLPRRANGKLDEGALPVPGPAAAGTVPPRSEIERRLVALWGGVLGRGEIGIHDDFFALGGHSLLATRLIARVRDAFGLEVPLVALFESPTIAGLAAAIENTAQRPQDPALPALGRRTARRPA